SDPSVATTGSEAPVATETPDPVVLQAWQGLARSESEGDSKSLAVTLTAMTEEDRASARSAVYGVAEVEGAILIAGEERIEPPSLSREVGTALLEELPDEEREGALASLDAVFYGVMQSKGSLQGSWRDAQQAQHGGAAEDALGASAGEWLVGVPRAYTTAVLWRMWLAEELIKATDDPEDAERLQSRANALRQI